MRDGGISNRLLMALGLGAALLTALVLHGCSNSLLRNTAEAGIETVLDRPLPTPTAAPQLPAPRPDSGR